MSAWADWNNIAIDELTELSEIVVSDKAIGKNRFEAWKRCVATGGEDFAWDIWTMNWSVSEARTSKWSEVVWDNATSGSDTKVWWRSVFLDQSLHFVALDRRSWRWALDCSEHAARRDRNSGQIENVGTWSKYIVASRSQTWVGSRWLEDVFCVKGNAGQQEFLRGVFKLNDDSAAGLFKDTSSPFWANRRRSRRTIHLEQRW